MHRQLRRLSAAEREVFITACTEAAHKLSESRADDRLRTYLAILGYIAAIIAAFLRTRPSRTTGISPPPPPPPSPPLLLLSRPLADAAQHAR